MVDLHLLHKSFTEYHKPERYSPQAVPQLDEWNVLWATWDTVTRHMIPSQQLLAKPINLRHPCLFYLGHIPTFLDLALAKATKGCPSPPETYALIFERGIDPDVDDPKKCHQHSHVPESWPPVDEILEFQGRVRDRVRRQYQGDMIKGNENLARALWMTFEHEIMHLETLLYMLLQSDKMLPPPNTPRPNFEKLAEQAAQNAIPNEWIHIPKASIKLGMDEKDSITRAEGFFGWDNERPSRSVVVPGFLAKARPITIKEYAHYLEQTSTARVPASWGKLDSVNDERIEFDSQSNRHSDRSYDFENSPTSSFIQGLFIRTVFGHVPLVYALEWPVAASYDELLGCATWYGGHIPTLEQVRSIYDYAEKRKPKEAKNVLEGKISAVNGHLSNDGVEESPPAVEKSSSTGTAGHTDPSRLFADLGKSNVGFKNWHPTPVGPNGDKLAGQGETGGLWEWTSTVLKPHQGFQPMDLYPGYTADFFDGKHNVVLGGSWGTHPRVAGRKSLYAYSARLDKGLAALLLYLTGIQHQLVPTKLPFRFSWSKNRSKRMKRISLERLDAYFFQIWSKFQ